MNNGTGNSSLFQHCEHWTLNFHQQHGLYTGSDHLATGKLFPGGTAQIRTQMTFGLQKV